MPYLGFEPQTAVSLNVVSIDAALEQTPTATEVALLACPDNANMRLELLSVMYRANTLPIDGSNDVFFDLEFIDDSASDDVSTLRANFNLAAGTALVVNPVWRGSQILEAGDVINAEFASLVTTPDTASEGASLIVEYRVLMRS